ncbi:APC family permease [Legionella parisiensis]|uniref:Glutamate/gamma-aminobutyrate antiporter n=1 Tax=Legionella parisiensis TaxID=45071 RepID=A0A1E5JN79_9GAMM|nr:APC family permease [Legionella parisiensis]KTD41343.1 amino acid antiporter [Legionella parisiensis]OEH45508.1 Glutamate/gamma-aminobutyrate antiporter [Legionella parisiensis]STX76354.1 amino acid antiporter [Legionella parisiensis]
MNKKLTIFSLTLMTVGSVDSIRNLPAAALVGAEIFWYFGLAFFFFLLPSAVISGWFSSKSHEGIYGWVRSSLGKKTGFIAVWFQWMQNILIYPAFFSFIAGAFLYCINPNLIENKMLLFIMINFLIWCLTWINIKELHLSNRLTVFCSIVGLLLPFILILVIGIIWIISHPESLKLITHSHQDSWASLTAIILSFCGIEIAGVHIQDSKPGAFPKAIALSVIIIFSTMLLGSLTLALLLSPQQLNFISGIPELFRIFFTQIQFEKLSLLVNLLIVLGCIGCANNWLIAPLKGLLFASNELHNSSSQFSTKFLVMQACGVSFISTIFVLLPSINTSYWFMITLATQMYLLMYGLMFASAIRLAWQEKKHFFEYIILFSFMGLIGIIISFIVTFIPPASLKYGSLVHYDSLIIVCLVFFTFLSILWKKILFHKVMDNSLPKTSLAGHVSTR